MAVFRLTFTDVALGDDGEESVVYYSYIDVEADRYENPKPGQHDFYDANGNFKCSYRDASISVDEISAE
jgi:hypothetical protein